MNFLLDWKSIGSLLATLMFIRTAIRDVLPPELYRAIQNFFAIFITILRPKLSITIQEFENSFNNEIFESVKAYLSSKSLASIQSLKLFKHKNSKNVTFTMNDNQHLEEMFQGFKVEWSFHTVEKNSNGGGHNMHMTNRFFVLKFHPKYLDKVNSLYLPHIMEEARNVLFKNKERRLYMNKFSISDHDGGGHWSSVPFSHPSTFDTIAMDTVLKEEIKEDLMKFVNQKEFYSRVGKAWKRGYLLYGPPGTGKTSLIAAIANFLEFDIFDLELTAVTSNSQLRKLLISTSSKSVIVVEDIDCSLDLSDRNKKGKDGNSTDKENVKQMVNKNGTNIGMSRVSLSGVLNFVDGLWSSCGGEKLIIFTTNHKENLDAALLRPGRMDKHINLSYCGISAFKTLAKNYLDIEEHEVMKEVDEMLCSIKMTPADVAELFMSCKENEKLGMRNVVDEMKKRMLTNETKDGIKEISRDDD